MRKAEARSVELDDPTGEGRLERVGSAHRLVDEREGGLRRSRNDEKRLQRQAWQPCEPGAEDLTEASRDRKRLPSLGDDPALVERTGQLDREERVAPRRFVNLAQDGARHRDAEALVQQVMELV